MQGKSYSLPPNTASCCCLLSCLDPTLLASRRDFLRNKCVHKNVENCVQIESQENLAMVATLIDMCLDIGNRGEPSSP